MTVAHIFVFLVKKLFFCRLLITVEVSLEPTGHSKVVYEKRILVDMLKNAELPLV